MGFHDSRYVVSLKFKGTSPDDSSHQRCPAVDLVSSLTDSGRHAVMKNCYAIGVEGDKSCTP